MYQQLCAWASGVWANCGAWAMFGFVGQGVFTARFVYQWIASERRKESVIPIGFWYLSIIGSLILLVYSVHRHDPVLIIGFAFNTLIYVRNLTFIYRKASVGQAGGQSAAGA